MSSERKRFESWMRKVNQEIGKLCGLSAYDLADICYYDYFLDGMSAREVAIIALENEGFPF